MVNHTQRFRPGKLTEAAVLEIHRRKAEGETNRSVARDSRITLSIVSGIHHRRAWKHLP